MAYPFQSEEIEELRENRCQRCGKVTDKLYKIGSGVNQTLICSMCRSEFVGE